MSIDTIATDASSEEEARILGPTDSQRMAELVDQQARRLLTKLEWAEMEKLVAKYGHLLHERRLRERARRRGVSLDQERHETEAHLAHALDNWHAAWSRALPGAGRRGRRQPARRCGRRPA